MTEMDDPFEYKKPEWLILKEREHRRNLRAKRLGREIGTWGGKREGAGTPKKKKEFTHEVGLNLSNIQVLLLKEMGKGSLNEGIMALINQHC
jgi:hypothetical protein